MKPKDNAMTTPTDSNDALQEKLAGYQHRIAAIGYPINSPGQEIMLDTMVDGVKRYIKDHDRQLLQELQGQLPEVDFARNSDVAEGERYILAEVNKILTDMMEGLK